MTPTPSITREAQARWILNSLGIIRDPEGFCSYPTQTAQFTYARALDEVSLWIARFTTAERELKRAPVAHSS